MVDVGRADDQYLEAGRHEHGVYGQLFGGGDALGCLELQGQEPALPRLREEQIRPSLAEPVRA